MARRLALVLAAAVAVLLAGCGPRSTEDAALRACGEAAVAWVNTENPEAYGCRGSDTTFPDGASD